METPLQIIESYGAPTTSFIRAIMYLREEARPMSKKQMEQEIARLLGADHAPSFDNEKTARLYFHYLVQETIRAHNSGVIVEMDKVWEEAQNRAATWISKNPWSVKDYASSTDANGNPRRKKGAKLEGAKDIYQRMNDGVHTRKDIIQEFIDVLEMTKAGATTYFHNMKKEFGFVGPEPEPKVKEEKGETAPAPKKEKKVKGPSKGAIAKEIYNTNPNAPKEEVIKKIIEATGTTPAGANTYYCAAKKG